MDLKTRIIKAIVLLLIVPILLSCEPKRTGGPHYFASFKGKNTLPMEMSDPIDAKEAQRRGTYYEAYYDSRGRIVAVKVYKDRKILYEERYRYRFGKAYRY